jgi:hypothetical protein
MVISGSSRDQQSPASRTERRAVADHSGVATRAPSSTIRPATVCRLYYDPAGAFVLAFEQVEDDGFQIGGFNGCLQKDLAVPTEIINHEVESLIVTLRHNPTASNWTDAYRQLPIRNRTGYSNAAFRS